MNEEELTEGDKKVISDIEKYGLHIVYVLADDQGPGFGFSIGLYHNYKHPEIIIIGLKQELTQSLINEMAGDIKDGLIFQPSGYYPDILKRYNCYFVTVDKPNYNEYVGYALWYYKEDSFPLIQCIYPTTKGIYPWEKEWPENIKDLQPILGPLKG